MSHNPTYHKAVLENGLTLVGECHPYVRSISLGLWVRVGSGQETPKLNGVSHFIEHMVFKGTEKRSALEIATVLESLGGDLNAFTDREITCFHSTVLSEHLELAVDVLSDLVFRPTFDKVQLDRERKVLLQELMMVEESPDDWIHDVFFSSVWKKHALGQTIIGTKKTIQDLSRAELVKFYELHYRPDNMILSVAGNFDFETLKGLCEKYFVGSSDQKVLTLRPPSARYQARSRRVLMETDQSHLLIGFEGIGFKSPQRFDALILSFFLGGGMSSRLFQEIREKAGLAYSVECDFVPFTETGVFTIYLATAPRSLRECLQIIGREVERLIREPLTEAELNLVKGQLKGTILLCADQMDTRQESLGRNEVVFGRYVTVDEVIGEIERVSPSSIQQLAKRLFKAEKETIVTIAKTKPRARRLSIFAEK